MLGACVLAADAGQTPAAPSPTDESKTPQIAIGSRFLEVPAGKFPGVKAGASGIVLTRNATQAAELLRALEKQKGVDVLSAPRVTALSGQRATVQIGREQALPKGSAEAGKFVGITLEVTATAKPDGIRLSVKPQIVSLLDKETKAQGRPVFHEVKSENEVAMRDGETVVLACGPSEKPGREIFVLIDARTIPAPAP
jgi:type II secretory pathway component GspD/PulD (secretin)